LLPIRRVAKKMFPPKIKEPELENLTQADEDKEGKDFDMNKVVDEQMKAISALTSFADLTLHIFNAPIALCMTVYSFAATISIHNLYGIWNYWFTVDVVINSIGMLGGIIHCCALCRWCCKKD